MKRLYLVSFLTMSCMAAAYPQPRIIDAPDGGQACPGSSHTLRVEADCPSGTSICTLFYQWYYEKDLGGGLKVAEEISGATSSSYSVHYNDISGSSDRFKVRVSHFSGYAETYWVTVSKGGDPYTPTGIFVSRESSCPGTRIILNREGDLRTGAKWSWYSGSCGGTHLDDGSNTAVYPEETTTYYLRQENDCGLSECVEVTVEVDEVSTAANSIIPDSTAVCPREEIKLTSSGGSLGAGAEWRWYAENCEGTHLGSGSDIVISQTEETAYYLRAEGNCDTTDCVALTLPMKTTPPPPTVEDVSICHGESSLISAGGNSIKWYPSLQLNEVLATGTDFDPQVTEPGAYRYYLTQTGTECESNPDSILLTIVDLPEQPFAGDRYGCLGSAIPDLEATGSNITWYSDPGLSNQVHTGNTFPTGKEQIGTHTWYLTQTVNNCAGPHDTARLIINNTPSRPVAEDKVTCHGVSGTELKGTGTALKWYSEPGPASLVFSGTVFTPGETVSGTHHWYVTQTISNCESLPDTATLIIKPAVPAPEGDDVIICEGEEVPALTVSGEQVSWYSDPQLGLEVKTGNQLTPGTSDPGLYRWYLVNTVDGCVSSTDSVHLEILAFPDAPVCTDTAICQGETIPKLKATGTNVKWFADEARTVMVHLGNEYQPSKSETGTYKWYLIDANGHCLSEVSVAGLEILVRPLARVGNDTSVCAGQPVSLGSYSMDDHSYAWVYKDSTTTFSNESNPQIVPDHSLTCMLTTTLQTTSCTDRDSITITVHPVPEISMEFEKNPVPTGQTTVITATGGDSYSWSPATGLSSTTGSQVTAGPVDNTTYSVSSTNKFGCTGMVSEELVVSCTVCSDTTFLTSKGTFNHGCTDKVYNNNTDCSWTIFPSGASNIYLFFHPDSFDIIPGDRLNIYDGQDAGSPLLASYDNDNPPPASGLKAGSVVFVNLFSDGTLTGRGFQARYSDRPTGIDATPAQGMISLYPNPNSGRFTLSLEGVPGQSAEAFVYDVTGQEIWSRKYYGITGTYQEQVDLGNVPAGIYFFLWRNQDQEGYNCKIIIR